MLRHNHPQTHQRQNLIKVKARFTNGALTPLEPVELEEGEEVTLSIDAVLRLSNFVI